MVGHRAEGSATGGAVISKQEFDFHLEAVLAPRLKGTLIIPSYPIPPIYPHS